MMWSIKLLWSPSKRSPAAGDNFCAFGPHTTAFCAFGPHETAVPILPPPAVTGYYWPPGHETFTFRPFTGETHRTQRESATFRLALFTTFFTAHHSIFKTVLQHLHGSAASLHLPGNTGAARDRSGLRAHGGGWARGAAARCVACARALIGAMCPRGTQ